MIHRLKNEILVELFPTTSFSSTTSLKEMLVKLVFAVSIKNAPFIPGIRTNRNFQTLPTDSVRFRRFIYHRRPPVLASLLHPEPNLISPGAPFWFPLVSPNAVAAILIETLQEQGPPPNGQQRRQLQRRRGLPHARCRRGPLRHADHQPIRQPPPTPP